MWSREHPHSASARFAPGAALSSFLWVATLVAGCGEPEPASRGAWPQPELAPASVRMEGYFPNVVLTTHEGERVRFYDDLVKGKIVVVTFMFTACQGICPLTIAKLARVQDLLGERAGRDVFFYSVTLDPENDTPRVLKDYAQTVGAKRGWTFLTGRQEDIDLVRRKLGAYDPDPAVDADKSQHGGVIVYGNEAIGRWAAVPYLLTPRSIAKAVFRVLPPATS